VRLTKRAIDAATYTGTNNARCVLWDDEVPGFGCRIFPSGRKGFVLSYRAAGRSRLLTIGTCGVLTLDQARTAARSELAKVETEGADPVAAREQERHGETMRDLCAAYLEQKRDRWVTPDELPRLAQAINEEPNEAARAALDQHGARIMGAAGLTPTTEVTQLPTLARTAAK
jgi:hypothetical protein